MVAGDASGGTAGDGGGGTEQGTAADRATSADGQDATRDESVGGEKTIRVLHVDDDPGLLEVTETYLQKEDERIDVETATSPAAALDVLDKRIFDVVVSDYKMPDMDGLDFLERVREDSEIPFIIFTGRGREEVAVEALNLGADRYLQKGGEPKSQYGLLADAIVQEAAHRRAREDLRESEERYRTLVEAFPDIVFITDYDSQMLWANDELTRQTGLTIEDFQMDQEDNPFIHPDDADRVAAHIGEFVQSDAKYSDPVDNRFVDAEGETHWFSSIIAKITYEGQPALQFITREVTERKQRRQQLERVERRHRTLVENLDGLVALFDDDLRYVEVGGHLLAESDLTAATIEGERVADVDGPLAGVDPDDCRAVFEGEEGTRTVDHDGQSLELRLQPVTDGDEVTTGMVVVTPD